MKKDLTQEKIPVWVVDDDEVRYSIRFALATHGIDTPAAKTSSTSSKRTSPAASSST